MPPRLITIDPLRPAPEAVALAASQLERGGLVVLPTETVYGLAADPRQAAACRALYGAKGRAADKPVALFAADAAHVRAQGVAWPPVAERLAEQFWPGALTLVLKGPAEWVGFRVPNHAVPLAVLRRMGHVLAVTSANRSGDIPVANGAEAALVFAGAEVLILDAGPGGGGVASTVVRVEKDTWTILRQGAIDAAALRAVAGSSPA